MISFNGASTLLLKFGNKNNKFKTDWKITFDEFVKLKNCQISKIPTNINLVLTTVSDEWIQHKTPKSKFSTRIQWSFKHRFDERYKDIVICYQNAKTITTFTTTRRNVKMVVVFFCCLLLTQGELIIQRGARTV